MPKVIVLSRNQLLAMLRQHQSFFCHPRDAFDCWGHYRLPSSCGDLFLQPAEKLVAVHMLDRQIGFRRVHMGKRVQTGVIKTGSKGSSGR